MSTVEVRALLNPANTGQVVSSLHATPGFALLPVEGQARLNSLLRGADDALSGPCRQATAALLTSPDFRDAPAPAQAERLGLFLANEAWLPAVVSRHGDGEATARAPFTVGPAVPRPDSEFSGRRADALAYEVRVGGQVVPVQVAATFDGMQHHTIDEVAKALAALPPSSLALVHHVVVEPGSNPLDAHWAEVFGQPEFHSYMTADSSGDVRLYTLPSELISQASLDGSMIHETGHVLSKRLWGDDTHGPAWAGWRQAAAHDELHASVYAKGNADEDFAETLELYQQVKGTAQEPSVRALLPERFAILDGLTGPGSAR